MRLSEFLTEDEKAEILPEAAPNEAIKAMRFYHGTHEPLPIIKKMITQGIKGRDEQGKGMLAPVAGRAYMSASLRYAIIYALGGDILGSDYAMVRSGEVKWGHVFVFNGADLTQDIQPDEDSMGEFVSAFGRTYFGVTPTFRGRRTGVETRTVYAPHIEPTDEEAKKTAVFAHIWNGMTPNQRANCLAGEYAYFASGGKRALKNLPDWAKLWLISHGDAHAAVAGQIIPQEVWRFDRSKPQLLAKDGSNFFELAKRIA